MDPQLTLEPGMTGLALASLVNGQTWSPSLGWHFVRNNKAYNAPHVPILA